MNDYRRSFAWLIVLYTIQGIVLGLTDAFPILLQVRGASIALIAMFSLVHWPFSLKLLWAPIVDNIFSRKLGKRTTWILLTQLSTALCLYFIYSKYDTLMENNLNNYGSISFVAFISFIMTFLIATQDIAVDGLAIEVLPHSHVHLASTANTAGQCFGYSIGLVIFMAITSKDFCNKYLGFLGIFKNGLIFESTFIIICAITFVIITFIMWMIKFENKFNVLSLQKHQTSEDHMNLSSLIKSYKTIYDFLKVPKIRFLCFYLLTMKVTFAATDGAFGLKLLEAGLNKDVLTAQTLPLIVLKIVASIYLSHYLNKKKDTLKFWLQLYTINSFLVVLFGIILLIFQVGGSIVSDSPFFLSLLFIVMLFSGVINSSYHMISMAYFAALSVGDAGGTRMTLLNTVSNLSSKWSSTLAVFILGVLPQIKTNNQSQQICPTINVSTSFLNSAICFIKNDGFYWEIVVCLIYGVLWLQLFSKPFLKLNHPKLN